MSFDVTGSGGTPREPSGVGGRGPAQERRAETSQSAYTRRLEAIWEPKRPSLVVERERVDYEEDDGLGRDLGIPERAPVSPLLLGGIAVAVVGVVLAVLFVLTLTSGGEGRTAPDDEVPGAPAGPPVAGVIGEPIRVGTLAFKVHDVREVPASQEEQPAAGMRWFAVDVEVVNEGGDEAAISMLSMFDLEASNGESYLPTIIGSVARYAEGDLPPGLRLRGEVVFEVPQDAGGFTLLITTPDRLRTGRVSLG